jgi:ribosome-associated protein
MSEESVETTEGVGHSDPVDLPRVVCRAAEVALERKALGVVGMDLRGISTATNFFLIASGNSDVQVKAIADHLIDELKKVGERPAHVEGLQSGSWVLLDYIDFVVHIFHPQAREFYQLEVLWGDAPTRRFEDAPD